MWQQLKRWLDRPAGPSQQELPLKMIVGLGNPGPRYARNRHNVGFQCVNLLAARYGLSFDVKKAKAKVALGVVYLPHPPTNQPANQPTDQPTNQLTNQLTNHPSIAYRLVLVKPQTFMNLSGRSVAPLVRFYRVELADMLVVYDDLDLPLGRIRLRPNGGAGGHNGMKSLIRELGSNQFPRLRVGIGRPPGRMDPADYVLQDFSAAEEEVMAQVRETVVRACEHWLLQGIEAAMNVFNMPPSPT